MVATPPQTDTYGTALDVFDKTHPLRVDVDENLKVTGIITNFPSTLAVTQGTNPWTVAGTIIANQGTSPWAISGTVAATQSGAWSTGRTWALSNSTDSVNVGNFPATQPVSGTIAATQSGSWTTGRTWALSNATDSVNVGNFPATQPVSGTVAVTQSTSPWVISGTVAEANVDKSFGTWAYYAGVSGTVTVSGGQRVVGIACHASVAATMTINGGASIAIPATMSVSIAPLGNVTAPTIVFTNTDSYFIEVVS